MNLSQLRCRPMTLIETLVYVALFAVVSGVAVELFITGSNAAHSVSRACDRIVNVTRQGDRWRADVRNALDITVNEQHDSVEIVTRGGNVIEYTFRDHTVWRSHNAGSETAFIPRVQQCRFTRYSPDQPRAWKMALELREESGNAGVEPLFDFIAVAPDNKPGAGQ